MNAHLAGASLVNAHLEGANLMQAHLEGADLNGAHLQGADLGEVVYDTSTDWPDGPPEGAILAK